jgi:hypothetical protein
MSEPASDAAIVDLLRRSSFSFIGTVEHLGAATMGSVPIGERTAVVQVNHVMHAPPAFTGIDGQRVTLELAADQPAPAAGDSFAFFAEGLAFGESMALREVGRLPVDAVMGHVNAALDAGSSSTFAGLLSQVEADQVREHAAGADAVVVGRVVGLARAFGPVSSEHDPEWWKATLDVFHVEKGNVKPGQVTVLYPNSIDVQWRAIPKPKASQGGLWFLHATSGDLAKAAPYALLHPEDFQPTQELDSLRGNGGE